MSRAVLVVLLLLLEILSIPNLNMFTANYEALEGELGRGIPARGFDLYDTTINKYAYTLQSLNLSYEDLYGFISELKTEYGGIKPDKVAPEAYANSTFWALLTLKITGRLDKYKALNEDLSDFLNYLYDEKIGGFREYLEGTASLIGTGFGLLISNLTSVFPTEFNKSKTLKYIEDSLSKPETDSDLLSIVMAGLSFIMLGEMEKAKTLASKVENFYESGIYYDPDYRLSSIYQTYLTLVFLKSIGAPLGSQRKSEIINKIISFNMTLKNGSIAFGTGGSPTSFETGLATTILFDLQYDVGAIKSNITRFLLSNLRNSAFTSNLNESNPDVFSTAGAILALQALGILYDDADFAVEFSYGDQIPIDVNETELKIRVKLQQENLDWFYARSNLTSEIIHFNSVEDAYVFPVNVTELGFGRFNASITLHPALYFVANVSKSLSKAFRIGYNISAVFNSTTLRPSQTLQANITVSYYNNSQVNGSTLLVTIVYGSSTVFNESYLLNATPVIFNYSVPNNAGLGIYRLKLTVNDSYGFNHTYLESEFSVIDEIVINNIQGNRTFYHLGEVVSINASLKYNYSGSLVSNVNVSASLRWYNFDLAGNVTWLNATHFNVNFTLLDVLPAREKGDIQLKLLWQSGYSAELQLAEISLNTSSLKTRLEGLLTLEIGEVPSLEIVVYSSETGHYLENATVIGRIVDGNETLQEFAFKYNNTSQSYKTEQQTDPNIPEGTYNLSLTVETPWDNDSIQLSPNHTIKIVGVPSIDNESLVVSPESPKVGDTILISFKAKAKVDGEIRNYLSGLILKANLSTESRYEILAVNEVNGTYLFSFKPQSSGDYTVTIFRESDGFNLTTLNLNVEKATPSIYEILEPYLIGLLWLASLVITGAYIVARSYIGRRISKRYLVRKARKKK